MTKPTIAIIQETRRAKSGNKFPLKLRVTYKRKVKYYPTKESLSKEDFSKLYSEKLGKKLQEIRDDIFILQGRAEEIADRLTIFTFKTFESKLFRFKTNETDLIDAYKEYIEVLKMAGRVGTASSYECSLKSFAKFNPQLKIENVTPDFLGNMKYGCWKIKTHLRLSEFI